MFQIPFGPAGGPRSGARLPSARDPVVPIEDRPLEPSTAAWTLNGPRSEGVLQGPRPAAGSPECQLDGAVIMSAGRRRRVVRIDESRAREPSRSSRTHRGQALVTLLV